MQQGKCYLTDQYCISVSEPRAFGRLQRGATRHCWKQQVARGCYETSVSLRNKNGKKDHSLGTVGTHYLEAFCAPIGLLIFCTYKRTVRLYTAVTISLWSWNLKNLAAFYPVLKAHFSHEWLFLVSRWTVASHKTRNYAFLVFSGNKRIIVSPPHLQLLRERPDDPFLWTRCNLTLFLLRIRCIA